MSKGQCPKCGDDTGYYTVVKETTHQWYNWKGEGTDSNTVDSVEGKLKRCLNCNSIIFVSPPDKGKD